MVDKKDNLTIARELEAMAQTGLHFSRDSYDIERYTRLREIACEMLAGASNLTKKDVHEWSKAEFGYATPKVDVRAFILSQEDKVFLVSEDIDEGRWTLPGGWADVNETPAESVVREVEEESGYIVETLSLLAVLDRERQGHKPPHPYHVYKLFFHCEITGGAPKPTAECSKSDFFDVDALPELSKSRVLEQQIKTFYNAVKSGDRIAIYD